MPVPSIEWDVEPHHTAAYIERNKSNPNLVDPSHLSIEAELKKGTSDKHRKEVLKQNYHCIATGNWLGLQSVQGLLQRQQQVHLVQMRLWWRLCVQERRPHGGKKSVE